MTSGVRHAIAPLLALPPEIASVDMINDALDVFAARAQALTRGELVEAAQLAVHLLECVRPEWLSADCEAAIACVLREVDRERRAEQCGRAA